MKFKHYCFYLTLIFLIISSCSKEEDQKFCFKVTLTSTVVAPGMSDYVTTESRTMCDKTESEIKDICNEMNYEEDYGEGMRVTYKGSYTKI